jgi:acyl carrier protein
MDIEMFRDIMEEQVKECFGEDATFASHEYVHHRKFRKDRVGNRFLGGGPEGVSQLHELVNRMLTDDERERVFPGVYDLGNFREVPEELRKYVSLEEELLKENNGIDPHETLKTIKNRIASLLDRKFSDFFEEDKSKALKVLKTLYRFQREYKTLFTLLAPPQKSGKPSFEIRDSYGIDGSTEEVEIIADLKAHLSFEIPRERLKNIMSTYGQMRSVLDGVEELLANTAAHQSHGDVKAHSALAMHIADCVRETFNFPERQPAKLALDEYLFTYMIQLEHYHHMQAYAELHDVVVSIEPPFGKAMEDIDTLMWNVNLGNRHPQLIYIKTNSCESFFQDNQPGFIHFYSRLFGRLIDEPTYQKAVSHVGKFSEMFARADLDNKVSLMPLIGAVALILTEQAKSTPFKPFWYGRKHISGGLFEFLNKVDFKHINFDASEGSLRYWMARANYLTCTILGQQEVFKSRLLITNSINEGITRILDTRDLDLLEEKLSLFVSTNGGTAP